MCNKKVLNNAKELAHRAFGGVNYSIDGGAESFGPLVGSLEFVSVEGCKVSILDKDAFLNIVCAADILDVFPKTNGKVMVEFTFNNSNE